MRQKLDTQTLQQALTIMGQYLQSRKLLGEIALCRGRATMFQYEWIRRETNGIGAIITSIGNDGFVQAAAYEAAKRLGLDRSWLVDAIYTGAFENLGLDDPLMQGMYPDHEGPGLRIVVASEQYILAMKMIGSQRWANDDESFQEAVALCAEINIKEEADLFSLLQPYFDTNKMPDLTKRRIGALASAIVRK